MDTIQNLGRPLILKGYDICNLLIGELYAGDGISLAGCTVAQGSSVLILSIAFPMGVHQGVFHIAFLPAGGGKGIFIPHAVLFGVGIVEFPDRQAAGSILINGCGIHFCCKHRRCAAEEQNERHEHTYDFLHCFHFLSFL